MGIGAVDLTSTKWSLGTENLELDEFELGAVHRGLWIGVVPLVFGSYILPSRVDRHLWSPPIP